MIVLFLLTLIHISTNCEMKISLHLCQYSGINPTHCHHWIKNLGLSYYLHLSTLVVNIWHKFNPEDPAQAQAHHLLQTTLADEHTALHASSFAKTWKGKMIEALLPQGQHIQWVQLTQCYCWMQHDYQLLFHFWDLKNRLKSLWWIDEKTKGRREEREWISH